MEKINKSIRRLLTLSLILSFAFVSGIPCIVFGAISRNYYLLVTGIVFVVLGFYGMPVSWLSYGEKRRQKRIVFAITVERLMTVQKIAALLQINENSVRNYLSVCFNKGYLIGFVRDGDKIRVNADKVAAERLVSVRCEFCGAPYNFSSSDENPLCPYCGSAKNTAK